MQNLPGRLKQCFFVLFCLVALFGLGGLIALVDCVGWFCLDLFGGACGSEGLKR